MIKIPLGLYAQIDLIHSFNKLITYCLLKFPNTIHVKYLILYTQYLSNTSHFKEVILAEEIIYSYDFEKAINLLPI